MAVKFQHTITEEMGLHARPAGLLVRKAKSLPCTVTVACREKSCEATKLMKLMCLEARQGDVLDVTVEGPEEETAAEELRDFLQENL